MTRSSSPVSPVDAPAPDSPPRAVRRLSRRSAEALARIATMLGTRVSTPVGWP